MPSQPIRAGWHRLPLEVQLMVLDSLDISAAIGLHHAPMTTLLVQQQLLTASICTQQSWWSHVLDAGWLGGARILVDACVPYLPALDVASVARWPARPAIMQLLMEEEMIVVPSLPADTATQHYACTNRGTLLAMACCLSPGTREQSAWLRQLSAWLRQLWTAAPTFHPFAVQLLANRGNVLALTSLNAMHDESVTPGDFIKLSTTVKVLEWLEKQENFNVAQLIHAAAQHDNVDALTWLWTRATAPDIEQAKPLLTALEHASLRVLEWLHGQVGVACTGDCPVVLTDSDLACDTLPADVGGQKWLKLDTIKWLHAHHPHALTASSGWGAAKRGELETIKWLHTNCRRLGFSPQTILAALGHGRIGVVEYLDKADKKLWSRATRQQRDAAVAKACGNDLAEALEWAKTKDRRALESLYGERDHDYIQSPRVLGWLVKDEPENGPWDAYDWDNLYENQSILQGWLDFALEDTTTDYDALPPLPANCLEDYLICSTGIPHGQTYFLHAAIRQGDLGFVKSVLSGYCMNPKRIEDLPKCVFDEPALPVLRALVSGTGWGYRRVSLKAGSGALAKTIKRRNTPAALWLVQDRNVVPKHNAFSACVKSGSLPMLQLLHSRYPTVAHLLCIKQEARAAHQMHIVKWCERQLTAAATASS
ncbi:hypothetical protein RI367_007518 [Sorochytrium milnesiophthora]